MQVAPSHAAPIAPPGRAMRVWGTFWRVVGGALAPVLLYAPLHVMLRPGAGAARLAALECVGALVMGAAALLFARRSKLSVNELGLAPRSIGWHLGLGVGVGALWLALSAAGPWALGWLTLRDAPRLDAELGFLLLLTFANASLQELMFRGYPGAIVTRRHGVRASVTVTTLLFVAMHLGAAIDSPLALLNLTLGGAFFALLRVRSRALWLPIGVHFAWNALLGPIAGLSVSGHDFHRSPSLALAGPTLWSGGTFGLEGSLGTTLATALGLVVLAASARRAQPGGDALATE